MRIIWLAWLAMGCTAHNIFVDDLATAEDLSNLNNDGGPTDAAADAADAANPCSGMVDGTFCGAGYVCRAGLCAPNTCGNHLVDPGEECDDQNLVSGDGCEADCRFSCHGDSDCNDGNACDGVESCISHVCVAGAPLADGTACGSGGMCRSGLCAPATCGNKVVDPGEECDDQNLVSGDGCEADCRFSCHADSDCNDSDVCNGTESCANHLCVRTAPLANGAPCASGGTCRAQKCAASGCGNKVLDPGEECDDGNLVSGDGCESDCTFSCHRDQDCSDGDPCNGSESCGNNHACTSTAPLSDGTPCGGGRLCRGKVCALASCGDQVVQPPEECDDKNLIPGDGCENNCTFSCHRNQDCDDFDPCNGVETCAANHACQSGIPPAQGTLCDADGNAATRDLCSDGKCAASACGDGITDGVIGEQCDDHNTSRFDGCDSNCRIEQSQRLASFAFLDSSQGCTDLDGDAAIDNALGTAITGTSLTLLNQYVTTGMGDSTKHLIYFADLDDLLGQNDSSIRLGFLDGFVHLGNFTGMKGEAFDINGTDLDAMGLPKSLLAPGSITAGALSAGLGSAPLRLFVFGGDANLVLRRTFAAVTPDSNIMRIDSLASGVFCGHITAGELDRMSRPSEIAFACGSGSMLDLLVHGCNFAGITVAATQPDIDVAGNGLGFLVDTDNDGIVDQCHLSNGAVINGTNCAQDDLFDEAYSFAANFTAIRVQIVAVR
jgi:cysteine-rich repeat protein